VNKGDLKKRDYEALAEYRYAIRRYLRFSEEAVRKFGVTPQQYQIMLAIKGYPGREHANISELAERMQLDHHSTVGLVDRAEERGLIRREQSIEDRRRVNVFLTAEGEDVLRQLVEIHRAELKRMREDLRPPGLAVRRKAVDASR